MIYLIANTDLQFCKIGTSRDPKKRLAMIQTGCPYDLHILAEREGDFELEKQLHLELNDWRMRGEWFEFNDKLLEIFLKSDGQTKPNYGTNLRGAIDRTLREMMESNGQKPCDYETWVDNILYAIRDAADEFAEEGDAALLEYNPDKYPILNDPPSMVAWRAIIDMALWGKR